MWHTRDRKWLLVNSLRSLEETRTFGGGGGGRGGAGTADVQQQLHGVVRNKLIYCRIATALRVRSYVDVYPEDEKPSAGMQKGYTHALSIQLYEM